VIPRASTVVLAVAITIAGVGCGGEDEPAAAKDAALETSTLPEVCGPLGDRSKCRVGTHLEPRPLAEQEDCAKGIADRRCGEARFLLEECFYRTPICYTDAGVALDSGPRCVPDRERWDLCQLDAGR
jgi:hypothetical protein